MTLASKNSRNPTQVGREEGRLFSQANMMQFIHFQLVYVFCVTTSIPDQLITCTDSPE